jgi:LacI family transcriptional regulator
VREDDARSSSDIANRITVDRTTRLPLATQIAQQLTWLIATGFIATESPLPVIADLADRLGVNVHTVRAAYQQLRDDGLVAMRRGARTTVLGYDRYRASNSQDRHPSFTVGVLVPSFSDYYADFLEAVATAAEVEGWLPVICQTHLYDPAVVARYVDQLFSRNVDGFIAIHFETPGDSATGEILRSSAALRPFVFVDSAEVAGSSAITVDRRRGGLAATTHLLEHGHQRIGFLAPPESWSSTLLLGAGYAAALQTAGIEADPQLIAHASDFSLDAGAKATRRLIQQADPPTAIFCAGDILALGAVSALDELRLRVPQDVAIMGYGEIPFAALAAPSLSSTRMPADALGYEAVRVLRRAIDEGTPQPQLTVETTLVLRDSCNYPPLGPDASAGHSDTRRLR